MITQGSLKDSDAKVKYYTGLPSHGVLKAVFVFVYPCVENYSRTLIPLFDQFPMVPVLTWTLSIFLTAFGCTLLMCLEQSEGAYERLKVLVECPGGKRSIKPCQVTLRSLESVL